MNPDWLTISQAAGYLRISPDTLRRWEKKKILKAFRSPTGWRYYDKKQLDYVFTQKPDIGAYQEQAPNTPTARLDPIGPVLAVIPEQMQEVNNEAAESPQMHPEIPISIPAQALPLSQETKAASGNLVVFLAFFLSCATVLFTFFLLSPLFVKPISPIP